MKKLEMIIRPEKLEELKEALNKVGITGMTVTPVMGCGKQKGKKEIYRGAELTISLLHKFKVEAVVADSKVDAIVKTVRDTVNTGNVGDGKIFIYGIEDAVRIRTGETGEQAI